MLFVFITNSKVNAQSTDYKAYSLYVYNFMKYVEWPEEESKGDFVIALVGDSKIKDELLVLSNHKKVKGRKIVFKQFTKLEDITYCHLLYVSSSKSSSMASSRESSS